MNQVLAMLGINQSQLDDAIMNTPSVPSRLLSEGMWRRKNLLTTSVMVEFVHQSIHLIPARSRHDASNMKTFGQNSTVRSFTVPHLPLTTVIRAEQLQDVRKMGTLDALTSNTEVMADEIMAHRSHHDATLEHLMLGAIKGQILDADGKTELFDLFREFNITKPSQALPFSTASSDLGQNIEQMVRQLKKALRGDVATGVNVLCSPEFFDALVSHKSTKEAWQRYQDNVLARENTGGKFAWKGANFEIYDYSLGAGSMIEAGHAHAYLTGTRHTFALYYAPANLFSEVNKVAKPFYVDVAALEHQRGISIYSESNPLPLCLQPQTLMHLTSA